MMKRVVTYLTFIVLSLSLFAQSMSEIESLCQKAIVAAQNNDFTTITQNYDAAIEHFAQAQKIARSHKEIGMRDRYALDAEMLLADLFLSKGTDEYIVLSQH